MTTKRKMFPPNVCISIILETETDHLIDNLLLYPGLNKVWSLRRPKSTEYEYEYVREEWRRKWMIFNMKIIRGKRAKPRWKLPVTTKLEMKGSLTEWRRIDRYLPSSSYDVITNMSFRNVPHDLDLVQISINEFWMFKLYVGVDLVSDSTDGTVLVWIDPKPLFCPYQKIEILFKGKERHYQACETLAEYRYGVCVIDKALDLNYLTEEWRYQYRQQIWEEEVKDFIVVCKEPIDRIMVTDFWGLTVVNAPARNYLIREGVYRIHFPFTLRIDGAWEVSTIPARNIEVHALTLNVIMYRSYGMSLLVSH